MYQSRMTGADHARHQRVPAPYRALIETIADVYGPIAEVEHKGPHHGVFELEVMFEEGGSVSFHFDTEGKDRVLQPGPAPRDRKRALWVRFDAERLRRAMLQGLDVRETFAQCTPFVEGDLTLAWPLLARAEKLRLRARRAQGASAIESAKEKG